MPKQILMKLPAKSIRKAWIGSYGGHYECVVIFHTKPTKTTIKTNHLAFQSYSFVDLGDNEKNIAACMWKCDFDELYPTNKLPDPKEIEVTILYEREIEGFWTKDNRIYFPVFDADGY